MTRLRGQAFVEKMNAAKAAKERERSRFPDRESRPGDHVGPVLKAPKMDGRWQKEADAASQKPSVVDAIIARNVKKITEPAPAPATAPKPKKPATAAKLEAAPEAAAPAGRRELKLERKPAPKPVTPPSKGVLARNVEQPKAS